MLKQVFNREELTKALTKEDVWRWRLVPQYGSLESAIDHTIEYWSDGIRLDKFNKKVKARGKDVFVPARFEDAFAINLLDRFIRRIYKVRQSDRNRIIRQLKVLLTDSGEHCILKLDIKDCYESIPLAGLIRKYEDDMILAPQCLNLLKQIQCNLEQENIFGLPRGLSISPTLSELYLEGLDKIIASHPDILYSARYVDDIIIHCPKYKSNNVKDFVIEEMKKLELKHNTDSKKYYLNDTESAEFDYLGYAIRARILQKKGQRVANEVQLSIAKSKLDKIKSKIMVSLCEYKGDGDFSLLKRRLQYLSMLKEAKGGVNGDLLAGIAYNYQYVTDEFACLKPLDGFLHTQIRNSRFGLLVEQISELSRLSFYGIARKRNIGNFSRKKVLKITQAWRNV